ncbi:hypothetical protein K4F52_003597 [Lecanicillium sp. MT-2017a]|nr:hypothetical protein K4F52_003597 [Lecanicillium sp. MT-2017a]
MPVCQRFPLFDYLPYELRREIWLFALRDYRAAGVQYFKISDQENHPANIIFNQKYLQWIPSLAAPGCGPACLSTGECPGHYATSSDPWRHKNDSSYLIDSGLWTACKESRELMLKEVSDYKFPRSLDEYLETYKIGNTPRRGATLRFLGPEVAAAGTSLRRRESCYMTIFPDKDLFVFQRCKTQNFSIEHLNATLPFARKRYGFACLWNVAIEFEPASDNMKSARLLAEAIWEVDEQKTLFVIDYNAVLHRYENMGQAAKFEFRGDQYGFVVCSLCCASDRCRKWIKDVYNALGDLNYEHYGNNEPHYWAMDGIWVLACVEVRASVDGHVDL